MGQYYLIANMDKKEFFKSSGGLKLMEWSYQENDTVKALNYLLSEDWRGNRVYVIGDYANSHPSNPNNANYEDIIRCLEDEFNLPPEASIYKYVCYNFKKKEKIKKQTFRYLYNHATREYVDFHNNIKLDWWIVQRSKLKAMSVSPTSLLLAMGNGQGGGDYFDEDTAYLVGLWVPYSQYLETRNTRTKDHAKYFEFKPNFKEDDYIKPEDYQGVKKEREDKRELFLQDVEGLLNRFLPIIHDYVYKYGWKADKEIFEGMMLNEVEYLNSKNQFCTPANDFDFIWLSDPISQKSLDLIKGKRITYDELLKKVYQYVKFNF